MKKLMPVILFVILTGCVKDFDLTVSGQQPRYVIEGRISNLPGPYFVRVTLSNTGLVFDSRSNDLLDSAVGVQNAVVVISDDRGMSDTLEPCSPANTNGYSFSWGNGHMDSTYAPFARNVYTIERGYYLTNRFTGEQGRTYRLSVAVGTETFYASAYMPPVTPLDSAVLQETVIAPDGTRGLTPFAYFKEPQNQANYYLLQSFDITGYPYNNPEMHSQNSMMLFSYYVFDDKTLPAYVNGMMSRVLIPSAQRGSGQFAYNLYPNTPWHLRLSSLTQEAFEYFKQLGKQFEGDGNVYQPAPASPKGNISGNALGMFYATDVSYKLILQ